MNVRVRHEPSNLRIVPVVNSLLNSPLLLALALASPWLVVPLFVLWRLRGTPRLEDASPVPPSPAPLVSVVLPARNEAAHITACIGALRATTWPNWELIVVNDGSTDNTGDLARNAAAGDARIRVIDAPPLAEGWFGKQWACHTAMQEARGDWLLFTDADTRHEPELTARMMRVRSERQVDLLSVSGRQDMVTFWERAVQPVVFALILARFGGARSLERATRPEDVVANGQCFMMSRQVYDAIGGHEAVRDTVAEDLMMAQRMVQSGRRVSLALGQTYLSTRMYDGWDSLVRGWRKNVYAGGRMAMRGGVVGRLLFPVALVGFPLAIATPFLVAPAAFFIGHAVLLPWSVMAAASMLLCFAGAAVFSNTPVWRTVLAPVGAFAFAGICASAIARGQAVEWKGRHYQSS